MAVATYVNRLNQTVRTLVWDSEKEEFVLGSKNVAEMIGDANALSMIGGGDTVAFVKNHHLGNKYDFVSTSGGAMMEYIAFGTLPGLEVLV